MQRATVSYHIFSPKGFENFLEDGLEIKNRFYGLLKIYDFQKI